MSKESQKSWQRWVCSTSFFEKTSTVTYRLFLLACWTQH